jgi:hypothetical protein
VPQGGSAHPPHSVDSLRMAVDRTAGWESLQAALRRSGCPICRVASDELRTWVGSLLREYVTDPGTRDELDRALGYCPGHWAIVTAQGDALSSAILLRSVLGEAQRRLATRFRRGNRLAPGATCPACSVEQTSAQHAVQLLCAAVEELPEARELLAAGDGLCLTHLGVAVDLRDRVLGRARVLTIERDRIAELEATLEQLIEAHDAGTETELTPELAATWRQALRTVAGSAIAPGAASSLSR